MSIKRRDFLFGLTAFLGSLDSLQNSLGESIAMADKSTAKPLANRKGTAFNFNSSATDYDAENAYAFALISQLVYEPFNESETQKAEVVKTAKNWGYDDVYFFHNENNEINDSEALVLVNAESVVVAFRGSEKDSRDWGNNARFKKVNYLGGNVHRGFLKAFTDVWTIEDDDTQMLMKDRVRKEMQGTQRSLWFTGHSLGGAMAILAAASWAIQESSAGKVSGVYTYGQPRVGDQTFTNKFNPPLRSNTFRVINNNDVVARIPNIGYTDVGQVKYFDEDGDLYDESDLNRFTKFLTRLEGRLKDLGSPSSDGIKDHNLGEEYIPHLKAKRPNSMTV